MHTPNQSNPPTREQLIQALLYLIEGHSVPRRYVDSLGALIERQRGRRRAA